MSTEDKYVYEKEFCKSFTLETGWPLPNASDMYTEPVWMLSEFQDLKTALNRTKQKLNFFDLDQWHVHTTKMNPAGLVINHVRKIARPDFLTQAWCKFYEIACTSDLLPGDAVAGRDCSVFTVHLCEAPGAFVSALNHYMVANHEHVRLEWLAMTLNPYHEANGHPDIVSDDRLILNTLDNWEFGPDYTGDIFQPQYADHLYRTVSRRPGNQTACLVTADGSVDCSDDPGEQENAVARLHDHETMVALNVLRDGGSLVLKMFTVFECNTICRVYLLCCLFRAVTVRKPATSKPGNSEVYAVCTGYRGRSLAAPFVRAYFRERRDVVTAAAAAFPLSQIPRDFTAALRACSEYFCRMQTAVIEDNVDAWSRKEDRYRGMEPVRRAVCDEFAARYGVRPIRAGRELMPGGYAPMVRIGCKRRGGVGRGGASFAERTLLRHSQDPRQEADALYRALTECDDWRRPRSRDVVFWGRREHLTVGLSDVRYRLGKPVTVVRGSKFCSEALVQCRLRAMSKFPPPPPPPSSDDESPSSSEDADADARSLFFRFKADLWRATVCDVTLACRGRADDATAQQHRCLTAVIAALRDRTADGGDLLLVGYPLYTQAAVAGFYAVASMFEAHGLLRPDRQHGHAFAFVRYARHDGWLRALDAARDRLVPAANGGMALVSWMPVRALLEQRAYADMVAVNNLCIVHEVEPVLSAFLSPVVAAGQSA